MSEQTIRMIITYPCRHEGECLKSGDVVHMTLSEAMLFKSLDRATEYTEKIVSGLDSIKASDLKTVPMTNKEITERKRMIRR